MPLSTATDVQTWFSHAMPWIIARGQHTSQARLAARRSKDVKRWFLETQNGGGRHGKLGSLHPQQDTQNGSKKQWYLKMSKTDQKRPPRRLANQQTPWRFHKAAGAEDTSRSSPRTTSCLKHRWRRLLVNIMSTLSHVYQNLIYKYSDIYKIVT